MKYSLSPQEIPWGSSLEFPLGSGYISSYIPPLVTIHIHYLTITLYGLQKPCILATQGEEGAKLTEKTKVDKGECSDRESDTQRDDI